MPGGVEGTGLLANLITDYKVADQLAHAPLTQIGSSRAPLGSDQLLLRRDDLLAKECAPALEQGIVRLLDATAKNR
jgi:hypothetical protein